MAVDHADDLGETDLRGGAGEGVAAELAAPAGDDPVARQLQQNRFQEFAGRVGAERHLAGGELRALGAGQFHEGAQRVPGFLRQHGLELPPPSSPPSCGPVEKGGALGVGTMKFGLPKDGD